MRKIVIIVFLLIYVPMVQCANLEARSKIDANTQHLNETVNIDEGFKLYKQALAKVKFINNEQSFIEVVSLFRKATQNKCYPAYMALGTLYQSKHLHGTVFYKVMGEPNDLLLAIEYLKKAAELGSNVAQNSLAEIYLNEANLYNEKSKSQEKDVSDENNLIKLPDIQQALYWFELASKNGNPAAQGTLADLYKQGIGVPQDYTMAYVWESISVASQFRYNEMMRGVIGSSMMKAIMKDRDLTYTKLTSEQKDRAYLLVSQYKEKYIVNPSEYDRACSIARQIVICKNIQALIGP